MGCSTIIYSLKSASSIGRTGPGNLFTIISCIDNQFKKPSLNKAADEMKSMVMEGTREFLCSDELRRPLFMSGWLIPPLLMPPPNESPVVVITAGELLVVEEGVPPLALDGNAQPLELGSVVVRVAVPEKSQVPGAWLFFWKKLLTA